MNEILKYENIIHCYGINMFPLYTLHINNAVVKIIMKILFFSVKLIIWVQWIYSDGKLSFF